MAMSPSSLLAKLDELKKWQQQQQERLLRQHHSRIDEINNSDRYTLSNVAEEINEQENKSINEDDCVFNEDAIISPKNSPKEKQPFLKRGSGLQKYGLQYGDHKKPVNKMKPVKIYKTALHKRVTQVKRLDNLKVAWEAEGQSQQEKVPQVDKPQMLIKNMNVTENNGIKNQSKSKEITPLKVPEINMVQKAKWCSVPKENDEQFETYQKKESISPTIVANENSPYSSICSKPDNYNTDIEDTPASTPRSILYNIQNNPSLLQCLQKLAANHFGESTTMDQSDLLSKITLNDSPGCQTPMNNNNHELVKYLQELVKKYENKQAPSDMSAYEHALEKELRVFEQLEEKAMNSSFCSTNSSVMELLASTPSKVVKVPTFETIQECCNNQNSRNSIGIQDSFGNTSHESNAKKMLVFPTQENNSYNETVAFSEESSVCSEDLMDESVIASRDVIIKQNACTMTDDVGLVGEELLKSKLKELEEEIATFRVENRKLEKAKADLEREKIELQRSRRTLEKEYHEKREKLEMEIEVERKKLQKEKNVFEKYSKDLNNKPNRKEREEISSLKGELEKVRETLKLKETRNGTSQARLRNQIKSLEKDNTNLKEEIEVLNKKLARLQVQQAGNNKKVNAESKMLHEINKNLTKLTKEQNIIKKIKGSEHIVDDKEESEDSFLSQRKPSEIKRGRFKSIVTSSDDENYDNNYRRPKSRNKGRKSSYCEVSSDDDSKSTCKRPTNQDQHHRKAKSYETEYSSSYSRHSEPKYNSPNESPSGSVNPRFRRSKSPRSSLDSNPALSTNKENNKNLSNGDITAFHSLGDLSVVENYERVFGKDNSTENKQKVASKLVRHNSLNDTQMTNSKIETILPDGCRETKYPNGNVKTISPDGNLVKLEYFNGDIKETRLLDGTIRYFYKDTQIWQSTSATGDETFEFPDGQIETHFADGSSHVKFPNGIVKEVQADGAEQIVYPDGSVVNMKKNGERVLLLPNGQKEIHTEAHKRREYPDGTVKIIYHDGLQETRYSNGRIRMKDKDGNLIMDSHED